MAIRLRSLRDPYRPGTGPVIAPWIRPQRHNLLTFRRYWPWVSLATICLLLLLATIPLQNRWRDLGVMLLVVAGYGVLVFCFDLADHWVVNLAWQQRLRAWRKIGVVFGLTVLHWFWPAAATDLWLLYLIPMITIGVDLDRDWATILIVVTTIAMFLSAWPMPDWPALFATWPACLRNGLIRAILGAYLGMTSYLLARSLAYQTNTMRRVLGNLLNATIADRWLHTANTVATVIAELLTEAHNAITMNVLIYETTKEQMRLVGSSTEPGQALAEDGFVFQAAQGISGWAAQHGEPCFINSTAHDPEARFLSTPAFPTTRSALAMPLQLDQDHSVVLEIESTVPFDVAHEDLQLLIHAGHYLVNAHQRSTLLTFHQQLVRLGTTLADRIIHVNEIGTMLQEIGSVDLCNG